MGDANLIRAVIQGIAILLLSIAVHEYGHALVADKLGDRTPRMQGRVTLNPLAHADPIGTLLFPILGMFLSGGASYGFGWGRPVLVNPTAFNRKFSMRTANMLVAAAGPAMNILFGMVIGLVHIGLIATDTIVANGELSQALVKAGILNFVLAFFNLIPAPPLDGGAVIEGLLPSSALNKWRSIAPYGPFILMAVIFIPGLSRIFVVPALFSYDMYTKSIITLFGL